MIEPVFSSLSFLSTLPFPALSFSALPFSALIDGVSLHLISPVLATTPESEYGSWVLAGILFTLVVIYAESKLGGELSKRLNLPQVLGELVGGVFVGISVFHLLVFPETGAIASDSSIMNVLQSLGGLDAAAVEHIFQSQSEVISVLAELGVII